MGSPNNNMLNQYSSLNTPVSPALMQQLQSQMTPYAALGQILMGMQNTGISSPQLNSAIIPPQSTASNTNAPSKQQQIQMIQQQIAQLQAQLQALQGNGGQ